MMTTSIVPLRKIGLITYTDAAYIWAKSRLRHTSIAR